MFKIGKFILCSFICALPFTVQAFTLDEALINAYKTNSELNAQREALKASDEQIMQALSRWLPTVSAQAVKQYSDQKRVATTDSSGSITGSQNSSADGTQHKLTLSQNLFRSGADIASIRAAYAVIKTGRAKLKSKEQEIFLKTIQTYMDTLSTKENYQIAQNRERDNITLVKGTKHRFKAGDASKTDVALAEAELAQAKADKETAKANFETSKANFKAITGLMPKNLILPKDNIILPKNLHDTVNTALIENPDMIAAKNTADAQKKNIDVARGNILPSVDLQYSISDDTQFGLNTGRGLRNHTTTVSLTIPIFGVEQWSKLREQKRNAAQAQNEMNSITKAVKATAIQYWTSLKAEKNSLKANKEGYSAMAIAYKGAQASEKAGLISTLDVIAVQNKYFIAYANLVDARSKYYVALYKLKSIVGECTAQKLGLRTKYYDPLKNYNLIKWQLIGAF